LEVAQGRVKWLALILAVLNVQIIEGYGHRLLLVGYVDNLLIGKILS
jgi:hypothetical protein